jgi:hypothetical protein
MLQRVMQRDRRPMRGSAARPLLLRVRLSCSRTSEWYFTIKTSKLLFCSITDGLVICDKKTRQECSLFTLVFAGAGGRRRRSPAACLYGAAQQGSVLHGSMQDSQSSCSGRARTAVVCTRSWCTQVGPPRS